MKTLIVGSGWARHAASAFADRTELEIVGVVGRGSARSTSLGAQLRVPSFINLEAALDTLVPQVAVVAVDDVSNGVLSERLIGMGCDVLCAHPVAPTAEAVRRLDALAHERGRIVSTDYSLRACEELGAGRNMLATSGALMRLAVTYPGRLLPMALDLAIALAGPIGTVTAFGGYPEVLALRRKRTPAAFPPTVVLEHADGCVTTLVPCPHARPAAAFTITASCTEARLELRLPSGGAELIRLRRGGSPERVALVPARYSVPAAEAFVTAMRAIADAFVDAVIVRGKPPCPLGDEVAVRAAWHAITESLRQGGRVEVRARAGWD